MIPYKVTAGLAAEIGKLSANREQPNSVEKVGVWYRMCAQVGVQVFCWLPKAAKVNLAKLIRSFYVMHRRKCALKQPRHRGHITRPLCLQLA
jgi:hypothetical protein